MKLHSLRTKIVISTILACSAIVFVVSIIELINRREYAKEVIATEFANFERGAKQTIREAVWRFDWPMVQTVLESQTSQVISYIKICDKDVLKCMEHGTRNLTPFLEFSSDILYSKENGGEQFQIGSVYLQGHLDTFPQAVRNHLPQIFTTNLLSVFGVAIVLFFLFHHQVVNRLLALEHYTRKIDLQKIGSQDGPGPLPGKGSRPDEIDLLADAVEGLIDKTRDELARRETLERQLHHSQKMEALGNLAGGIAHDFNNILAAILGFAELSFLKTEPGSDLHNYIEKIVSAGQRAKNLTSQILVFSRRTETPREVLLLADIVQEALSLIRASLPVRVRIETRLDETLKTRGDSTRLHQVIMNIATNGAQALAEHGGLLVFTLAPVIVDRHEAERLGLPSGRYCLLEIQDNGPGIPEEIQARVFEPFFTTKKAGQGTGMGLAVVHGIVKNHGGAITLTSKPGTGARFSIYLPQTDMEPTEINTLKTIPRGEGQHIMLVDDEVQILEMGSSLLTDLGYDVISFSNPVEAATYFRTANGIDLLISDLTMPEMSGVELAQAVKSVNPSLPILLWTGYKDDIASASLDNKVIDLIIQKPFSMQILAKALHTLLDRHTDAIDRVRSQSTER